MALKDLTEEEIRNAFVTLEDASEPAALASMIKPFRKAHRDVLAGMVLAFLADAVDVDIDVAYEAAKELRESREAEFACGICSSLDDPAKA
jgi:hypothetical protein